MIKCLRIQSSVFLFPLTNKRMGEDYINFQRVNVDGFRDSTKENFQSY